MNAAKKRSCPIFSVAEKGCAAAVESCTRAVWPIRPDAERENRAKRLPGRFPGAEIYQPLRKWFEFDPIEGGTQLAAPSSGFSGPLCVSDRNAVLSMKQ